MKNFNGKAFTALADLFLPRLCCVCGSELGRYERHVCISCLADMPLTLDWTLRRNPMAERFNALIERGGSVDVLNDGAADVSGGGHAETRNGTAARIRDGGQDETGNGTPDDTTGNGTPGETETGAPGGTGDGPAVAAGDPFGRYVDAVALFNFVKDGGYRRITYRLKYGGDIGEGRHFAAMLGERAALAPWFSDVDTVIPVPLHWTRRLKRGYNQAEIIAREVAKALGARLRTDILVRSRRTSTQTRLGVEEKACNVRGAFAISRAARTARRYSAQPSVDLQASSGRRTHSRSETADPDAGIRHILLVDDVFTTGSTLYNCFVPLRRFFGPEVRISIATLGVV